MVKFTKEEIIEKLTHLFSGREEIVLGYLFGSVAEGRIHKFSDVDVAVYVKDIENIDSFKYELALLGELNSLLKSDEVDLVILNNTPPVLRHHILHHGMLLQCRDENFLYFYMRTSYHQYEDAKHILKIQNYYRDKRLRDYAQS